MAKKSGKKSSTPKGADAKKPPAPAKSAAGRIVPSPAVKPRNAKASPAREPVEKAAPQAGDADVAWTFVTNAIKRIKTPLQNLAARWADEQGFEDINDYKSAIVHLLRAKANAPEIVVRTMTGEPFGFVCKYGPFPFAISVDGGVFVEEL